MVWRDLFVLPRAPAFDAILEQRIAKVAGRRLVPTYRTGNLVRLFLHATEIEGQVLALVLYLFHRMRDLDAKFAVWFEFAGEDFRPPATEVIIVGSIPMCAVCDQNGCGGLSDPGNGETVPSQMIDCDNGSSCLMNGF